MLLLFTLRAWPRLFYPEVWDEDGIYNLIGFLTNGAADLSKPVNGYLILIPKLITQISASISLTLYPTISTVLAWAFSIFVLLVIAKAPTHLRGGSFLAFLCVLIPTDPENFGLPLYTFWWSALLLFVLIFWEESTEHLWFRLVVIALASLSSPVCIVTLPLFWARAFLFKSRPIELGLAIGATFFAGVQLWAMWPIMPSGGLDIFKIPKVVPVFLGNYAVGNIRSSLSLLFGLLILTYIVIGLVRNRRSLVLWGLCYLWMASVLMSITRVDIDAIHPILAGPRYFFFPFILLSWILLQLARTDSAAWLRAIGVSFLTLSIVNAIPNLDRKHDDLNWEGHIASCGMFSEYRLPIHYDGNADRAWSITLTGAECSRYLERDKFSKYISAKPYPYRVVGQVRDLNLRDFDMPARSQIAKNGWHGRDYYSAVAASESAPTGYEILGSFISSNADVGAITIKMRRGESVLFRSESRSQLQRIVIVGREELFAQNVPTTSDWNVLEFSSRLLPDEFDVTFVDNGDGRGEWSAVALRK